MTASDRWRGSWFRRGVVAGLAGAAVMVPLDLALAAARGALGSGFVAGAANVVVADLWMCLTLGLLLGFAALCLASPSELARLSAAGADTARSIARARDLDREPHRVAVLVGLGLFVLLALAFAFRAVGAAIGGVRTNALATIPTALTVVVCLLLAAATAVFAARLVERGLSRAPTAVVRTLCTRNLIGAGIGALAAALFVVRRPLAQFVRAFDPTPLLVTAVAAIVVAIALVASFGDGRLGRAFTRWSSWRRVGASLATSALALVVVAGFVGQSGPSVRTYRAAAPLSSLSTSLLTRVLDFDFDGYSAFFGDGDCASFDGARNPGARDVPGNGIDEDCFDGDQTASSLPVPPTPHPVPGNVPQKLSFIVVLVDAVRYDHLSLAGYERPTSPRLDAFAKGAVVFERAQSPSSYTFPSMTAIATSKLPSMLPDGVMRKKAGLAKDETTLATTLRDAGYRTTLVSDYGNVLIKTNVSLGFDKVKRLYDNAPQAIKHATAAIDEAGEEPFLIWISLVGPHNPYRRNPGAPDFGPDFIDVYDHELAAIDMALGTLFEHVAASTQSARTSISIISDHGEAFGEHGTYYHGHNLHFENVHVPWILSVPGIAPARFGAEPVSLIDLTPTLLNLARLPVPKHMVGHDQTRALATGTQPPDRSVFIESDFIGYGVDTGYAAAVVTRSHKLMTTGGGRSVALYDVVADPGETRDIAAQQPDVALALRRLLKRYQSFGAMR